MTIPLRNSRAGWGLIAITLHWLIALTVVGMFIFGLYMTGLTYYDPWYHQAPALHKSMGIVVLLLLLLRVLWRFANPAPAPLVSHSLLEQRAAKVVHGLLYLLLFAVIGSGYLIATAKGRPVEVFGLFELPALIDPIEHQEDIAGAFHLGLAITLMLLAGLHALAALKHHFLDKDQTLRRMLGSRFTAPDHIRREP
jgi:cytochrome b561